jgi:hypothetical protein
MRANEKNIFKVNMKTLFRSDFHFRRHSEKQIILANIPLQRPVTRFVYYCNTDGEGDVHQLKPNWFNTVSKAAVPQLQEK